MYEKLAKKVHNLKAWIVLGLDYILLTLTVFLMRGDVNVPSFLFFIPAFSVAIFYFFKVYQVIWRFYGWHDLIRIWKVNAVIVGVSVLLFWGNFPIQSLCLYYILSSSLLTVLRVFNRFWSEQGVVTATDNKLRTLIVGAGEAGEQILKSINKSKSIVYKICGFVDDDKMKAGARIHGVSVLGSLDNLEQLVAELEIRIILLAIPSAKKPNMDRILSHLGSLNVIVKTLPSVDQLVDGKVSHYQFKDFTPEDYLGREAVQLDKKNVSALIVGKKVFVTGAGGSIGSQLCMEIASFGPSKLCLFDSNEFNLYTINNKISENFPSLSISISVGDVRNETRLASVMESIRPDVVYHAAAYKHVPLMESNSIEAVSTNIFGTANVLTQAVRLNVDRFVLISTDKAVNPTNVMGATKRVAELLCSVFQETTTTKIMAVRFGNVLGSSGSVIPRFLDQIAHGGPVTVTHPDITRYFMSIPEASQLVLQASALGGGGEVFVLDMGSPVKIRDLAEKMIRFSGREGDIKIVYTGLRPGEKLYEELLCDAEKTFETKHPKIKVAMLRPIDLNQKISIRQLLDERKIDAPIDLKKMLKDLIPSEYKSEVSENEK